MLGEASLIQLAAEERENGRHRFDFFNGNFLAFLCDEANDALRRLLGDDRRNPGFGPILFVEFAAMMAAKVSGLKDGIKRSGAAEGAKFEAILAPARGDDAASGSARKRSHYAARG